MNSDENAEIVYDPDNDGWTSGGIENALAEAERNLGNRPGVHGLGMTKTAAGEDAIVVYVDDDAARAALPMSIGGCPVIGEVTGEIRPQ